MENTLPSIEKPSEKVLNFQSLNESQIQDLKDRIKEHDGLIRIFIHTLRAPDEKGDTKYQEREYPGIMRILDSENTPPVFFLEDTRDMSDINMVLTKVDSNGVLKKPAYIIETLERLPFPVIEGEPRPISSQQKGTNLLTEEDQNYRAKSMSRFLFQLHLLGVKKILIGGNNLEITDNGLKQCVALFIEDIKFLEELDDPEMPKIDIKVSMMTAPNNREDLKGIRDDLV